MPPERRIEESRFQIQPATTTYNNESGQLKKTKSVDLPLEQNKTHRRQFPRSRAAAHWPHSQCRCHGDNEAEAAAEQWWDRHCLGTKCTKPCPPFADPSRTACTVLSRTLVQLTSSHMRCIRSNRQCQSKIRPGTVCKGLARRVICRFLVRICFRWMKATTSSS
jgi:hypothetical protein